MFLLALGIWNSRTGRAFRAIRDSETAAQAMGISIGRFKLLAFIISGVYAGVAGSMYTAYVGQIEATDIQFSAIESVYILGGNFAWWTWLDLGGGSWGRLDGVSTTVGNFATPVLVGEFSVFGGQFGVYLLRVDFDFGYFLYAKRDYRCGCQALQSLA
jgi:hypothetical protein